MDDLKDNITEDEDVAIETEAEEAEPVEADDPQEETGESVETEEAEAEPEEVTVSFGDDEAEDEPEEADAPNLVNQLRKRDREKAKEIRELKKQLAARDTPAEPELGEKPTLQSVDYDNDRFEAELLAWHERKREVDARAKAQEDKDQQRQVAFDERRAKYEEAKVAYRAGDFEDAEGTVSDALSVPQQAVILRWANNPEDMIYALGNDPEKLATLAPLDDLIEFAVEMRDLEKTIVKKSRKPKTAPEGRISSKAGTGGATTGKLDRLREQARKSGDMSDYMKERERQRASTK